MRLPLALKLVFGRDQGQGKQGMSPASAPCTALSATIGTGNIVGVATAIKLGGPGALFWMWMAALFGMATKYAECLLAVKYRQQDANGQMAGGPMYYLERGSAPGRSPGCLPCSASASPSSASVPSPGQRHQ